MLAARKLGMAAVPTIELSHLSESQRRAYTLADNKIALNAGWDDDLLRLELLDLKDTPEIEATGFDKHEIEKLFDAVAAHEAEPELGEMQYRIVVDCADEEEQTRLLERFETEGLECRALIS